MRSPLPAQRALSHPAWWVALAILVVNDHWFKDALPGAVSGKLSDFAGLIVAPWVVAALLMLRRRRALIAAHVVVGAVFAAINLSHGFALGFEALTGLGPIPWVIQVDPSDLVALPMLLLSFTLARPTAAREAPATWLARTAVVPGALACMASGPGPAEPPRPPEFPQQAFFAGFRAELAIGNDTLQSRVIRVRRLRQSVNVDCNIARQNPSYAFPPQLFEPAVSFQVEAGQTIPVFDDQTPQLTPQHSCRAFLVDATGVSPRLLSWSEADHPPTRHQGDVINVDPGRTVFLRERDGRAVWDDDAGVTFPPFAVEDADACGLGEKGTVYIESPIPAGGYTLSAIASAPDGCWRLTLDRSGRARRWFLCIDQADFPFAAGETVQLSGNASDGAGEITITSTRALLRASVGAREVRVGAEAPSASLVPSVECPRAHDRCGSYVIPLELQLPEGTLRAGEQIQVGRGVMTLAEAARFPVVDTLCRPEVGIVRQLVHSVYTEVME